MRKCKMLIVGILTIVAFVAMQSMTFADNSLILTYDPDVEEITDVGEPPSPKPTVPHFGSFSGTVKEINELEDCIIYSIEKDDEIIANIIVDDGTYILYDEKIVQGDFVEGFYNANGPMLMIYPPQFTAVVITVNVPKTQAVAVDKFDENLVSTDGMLKLNISDEMEIILQDATPFDGEIANRNLVVVYEFATASIPAQTTPIKVIVLFEKVVPVDVPKADDIDTSVEIALNGEIVVEGSIIEANKPYINENGVVMVPLRAVAEKIGYKVTWDDTTQGIWLNNSISLSIGRDYYTYMRTAPIELGTAPELVEGHTYVPLKFFKNLLKINNVYVFEGQVVIDNGEPVQ